MDKRTKDHAHHIWKIWNWEIDRAGNDQWERRETIQAMYDCLNSMKHHKILTDFSRTKLTFNEEEEE